MSTLIPDRLTQLLRALDNLPYAGRLDAIVAEVLETGGSYPAAPTQTPEFQHVWALDLHGITATGPDEAAMIENWCCAAHARAGDKQAA